MLSVNFFVVGLFSSIMRDMANLSSNSPKWIVLDGDIDPMWIESLNTVMDDNKVCVYYVRTLCTYKVYVPIVGQRVLRVL